MECSVCRRTFDPEAPDAAKACAGCGLAGTGCGKVRCPHCGYDNTRPIGDAREAFRAFWRSLTHGAPPRSD